MRFLPQLLFVVLLQPFSLAAQPDRTVTITGKTFRPVDTLVLLKPYEDIRYHGHIIPVAEDSTFSFSFSEAETEVYNLIFLSEFRSGSWREIDFFTDSDSIAFSLFPINESEKNEIHGSDLVKQKITFEKLREELFKDNMVEAYQRKRSAEPGSDEGDLAQQEIDSLNKAVLKWQHEHLSREPNVLGLSQYYEVLRNLDGFGFSKEDLRPYHEFWITQFPDNSLTRVLDDTYNGQEISAFRDIDLRGISSTEGSLASVVQSSDYTLLDLWAPWCGPCLKKSKTIEKAYLELEQSGLVVIGIMGGIKSEEAYLSNLKKHDYPWKVYREISDEQAIWSKYGIPYSGGQQFLINRVGKIVAINPSVDEIRAYLAR